jgi:hypothetical protein
LSYNKSVLKVKEPVKSFKKLLSITSSSKFSRSIEVLIKALVLKGYSPTEKADKYKKRFSLVMYYDGK